MVRYIDVPFETDPDRLTDEAIDRLGQDVPGWVPREGHVEVWVTETIARLVAEAREVAARVPVEVFRFYGQSIIGLPPITAQPATMLTTWTVTSDAGFTIPAGTVVAVARTGDQLVPFETVDAHEVPPGQDAATDVTVVAVEPGAAPNGLGLGALVLVDALAYVDQVTSTTTAAGGVDAEPDDVYLDRLADRLSLFAPRPILADDFATFARQVAGVHRAVAIANYDPVTEEDDVERVVTVAAVDAAGRPVGPVVRDEVAAELEAAREVNFVVHVIDATYVPITVEFAAVAHRGVEPEDATAAAQQAVRDLLSPAVWGSTLSDPLRWDRRTIVRYLEVAAAIDRADGIDYITSLTVNGGTVDVALDGVAPLPAPFDGVENPSTVTGEAVAP